MLALFGASLLIMTPSCKKGENDPALSLKSRKNRLTADWTVSSYMDESTSTYTYTDDPNNDGDLLSNTWTGSTTFENGAISQTSSSNSTYDGQGFGGLTATTNQKNASGSVVTTTSTQTNSGTTISDTETGAYASSGEWTISFVKDGSFTMTRTMSMTETYTETEDAYDLTMVTTNTSTETIEGTWSFVGKNKADEIKNKERINLWYKSISATYTTVESETYVDKDASDFFDYTNFNYTSTDTNVDNDTYTDTDPDETWELDMLKNKEIVAMRSYSSTNSGTSTSSTTDSDGVTVTNTNTSNSTHSGTTTLTMTRE